MADCGGGSTRQAGGQPRSAWLGLGADGTLMPALRRIPRPRRQASGRNPDGRILAGTFNNGLVPNVTMLRFTATVYDTIATAH
jgi:hypothetical protein